jgi:antirestriction protein ArdC
MGYARTSNKPTVKETISNIMIERVEARRAAGENVVAPWRMTWDPTLGMPRNLVTGHAYRGINVFMTMFQGYASPFWITRKQVAKVGGEIKQETNEDGKLVNVPYTPILFWKFPTKEEAEEGRRAFCRFYQVWNSEQVDGIEETVAKAFEGVTLEPKDPIAEADALVAGYPGAPPIGHGSAKAFYVPSEDRVSMPDIAAFESSEAYYRVLFHELGHSTGHRNRLERDGVANPAAFASHAYSEEELIAEMTAALLAGHAGIGSEEADENSAAYLDHWLRKLKAEPNLLVSAGGAAQKAVDHIRNIKWAKAEETTPKVKGMYPPKAKVATG